MLNLLWLAMMVFALVSAVVNHHVPALVPAVALGAKNAVEIMVTLVGIMAFWLGVMEMAQAAGLVQRLAHAMRRPLHWLFPSVPADHPALGHMLLNLAANALGAGNAATPFGIKAMRALQTLNPSDDEPSDAMCLFLLINTSSVQLLPATAMAFLAAEGARTPQDIIVTTLLATLVSTSVAVIGGMCAARARAGGVQRLGG